MTNGRHDGVEADEKHPDRDWTKMTEEQKIMLQEMDRNMIVHAKLIGSHNSLCGKYLYTAVMDGEGYSTPNDPDVNCKKCQETSSSLSGVVPAVKTVEPRPDVSYNAEDLRSCTPFHSPQTATEGSEQMGSTPIKKVASADARKGKNYCKCTHSRKSHVDDFDNSRCCTSWEDKVTREVRMCQCLKFEGEI